MNYALAYWACNTANEAAAAVATAAQQDQRLSVATAENFRVPAGIHAPEELHRFDKQHNITLT